MIGMGGGSSDGGANAYVGCHTCARQLTVVSTWRLSGVMPHCSIGSLPLSCEIQFEQKLVNDNRCCGRSARRFSLIRHSRGSRFLLVIYAHRIDAKLKVASHITLFSSFRNYPQPCQCGEQIRICGEVKESYQRLCHVIEKHIAVETQLHEAVSS